MRDPILPPTDDELTQAQALAWTLDKTTSVTVTDYAAFAHGEEAWVCPNCLDVTPATAFKPLSPGNCPCGAVLQP